MCNLKLVSVVYWYFEASITAITKKRSYKSTLLQLAGRIFSTTTYIKRQCILQRDIKCVQSLSRLKLNKIELSGYFTLYTESVWFTYLFYPFSLSLSLFLSLSFSFFLFLSLCLSLSPYPSLSLSIFLSPSLSTSLSLSLYPPLSLPLLLSVQTNPPTSLPTHSSTTLLSDDFKVSKSTKCLRFTFVQRLFLCFIKS